MSKTVLLADDSITIQRVVELTFAHEDVQLVAVGDAEQAIEAITRSAPDLVLADTGMPGRSGYDLARWIRSQPHLDSLPILLLAPAFERVDLEQARLAGADGVLSKPFDPSALIGRVNELLATDRGGAAHQAHILSAPEPGLDTTAPVEAHDEEPTHVTQVEPAVVVEPIDVEPPLALTTLGVPDADLMATAPVALDGETEAPHLAPSAPATSDADSYFAQLDVAFAELARTPRPSQPAQVDVLQEDGVTAAERPTMAMAAGAALGPGITDAFTALLDEERTGTAMRRVGWGGVAPPQAPQAAGIDMDALADQIARRVLEQLTERVVRETVADIAVSTAERLVREEIERIKSNIK